MTKEDVEEIHNEIMYRLKLLNVIAAPIFILQLKLLDYQGRQLERLQLEQYLYNELKEFEFIDMKKLMSHTVYTDPNTQHPKT